MSAPKLDRIEAALVEAVRQQGADIETGVGDVIARFYGDAVGYDGLPSVVWINLSRLARDIERELAS